MTLLPRARGDGKLVKYQWAVLYTPMERVSSGGEHKYRKIASGSVESNFMPGSIARNAFIKTLGEGAGAGSNAFGAYLAVVFDATHKMMYSFYGFKRTYAPTGSKYWSVITETKFPAQSMGSYTWSRQHGRVIARDRQGNWKLGRKQGRMTRS